MPDYALAKIAIQKKPSTVKLFGRPVTLLDDDMRAEH